MTHPVHPAPRSLRMGRRPVDRAKIMRTVRFADIRRGAVPVHAEEADHLSQFATWAMLLNDKVGCCVVVTFLDFRRVMTALTGNEKYLTDNDTIVKLYRTQNPGFILGDPNHGENSNDDQGMNIQEFLNYLRKNGLPDGRKLLGFARVDHRNLEEVEAAIDTFGGVWLGINLTDANMDEFGRGDPWMASKGPFIGGHSIYVGKYDSVDALYCVTWAQVQALTPAFVQEQVDEAWVVIWEETLGTKQFREGIDLPSLAAAFQELTGEPFPVAAPFPEPQPAPAPPGPPEPVVEDADQVLAAAAHAWVSRKHTGINRQFEKVVINWLTDKGL